MRAFFRSAYRNALGLGDVTGKILSLLTLPATLWAGFVYFDEIRDFFSPPDFGVEIELASLRCAYVFRDPVAYQDYVRDPTGEQSRRALSSICLRSPVGISFEMEIENRDSIAREIRAIELAAIIPPYGELTLDEVRRVDHLVIGGAETREERDWQVETIEPGQARKFEIVATPVVGSEKIAWRWLSEGMDQAEVPFLDETVSFDVYFKTSGRDDPEKPVADCRFPVDDHEVGQWRRKAYYERIRVTGLCRR